MKLQMLLRGAVPGATVALALASAGCSSTSLDNMWRDPAYTAKPMKNVLVIAVRKSELPRRVWEDAFVAGLKRKGVTAVPSYDLFPNALPDTNQAVEKIKANGYDGVLVVSRLDPRTTTTFVHGYTTMQAVTRFDRWHGYYTTQYREVYTPSYTETSTTARNEIVLWSTGDDARMIWAGTTATENPDDGESVRKEVVDAVIPQLDALHVLGRSP